MRFETTAGRPVPQAREKPAPAREALELQRPQRAKLKISARILRAPAETITSPGAATSWSRAARFGVSPVTASSRAIPCPNRSPTTTSPVRDPNPNVQRPGSRAFESFGTTSTTAKPALTALSTSSSCALGHPK